MNEAPNTRTSRINWRVYNFDYNSIKLRIADMMSGIAITIHVGILYFLTQRSYCKSTTFTYCVYIKKDELFSRILMFNQRCRFYIIKMINDINKHSL